MSPWLIIGLIGAGTFLTRLSFIGIIGERQIPGWCLPPLRYVAPAVLAALVAPAVILNDGSVDLSPVTNPRLLAAVLAGIVTWRLKNVVWAILVGMTALWLLQWLL
jgi:branched-subunit amino acid transport protein